MIERESERQYIMSWPGIADSFKRGRTFDEQFPETVRILIEAQMMSRQELLRVQGSLLHDDKENGAVVEDRDRTAEWDDENGKVLDPKWKLQSHCVYTYIRRAEAEQDMIGKFIKTRWVLTAKGDEDRRRFVAQA